MTYSPLYRGGVTLGLPLLCLAPSHGRLRLAFFTLPSLFSLNRFPGTGVCLWQITRARYMHHLIIVRPCCTGCSSISHCIFRGTLSRGDKSRKCGVEIVSRARCIRPLRMLETFRIFSNSFSNFWKFDDCYGMHVVVSFVCVCVCFFILLIHSGRIVEQMILIGRVWKFLKYLIIEQSARSIDAGVENVFSLQLLALQNKIFQLNVYFSFLTRLLMY